MFIGFLIPVFVLFAIIFIAYVHYENHNLEVTHYTIHSDKIPKGFHGTKFVLLTDLHNNSFGINNIKLINEIHKANPEFILIAGDMIIGKENGDYSVTLQLIKTLAKKYPIYYGYGNHEQKVMPGGVYHTTRYDEYYENLAKLGVHFLGNDSLQLKRQKDVITITGLKIDLKYFKKPRTPVMKEDELQKLVGIFHKECYNILIAHNPTYFKNYINLGADLVVAGHIHGGMVRLPLIGGIVSPQYRLFPKYDAGRFEEAGKTMLVSRGLGMHTIKIRVFNRPELMVVTLQK